VLVVGVRLVEGCSHILISQGSCKVKRSQSLTTRNKASLCSQRNSIRLATIVLEWQCRDKSALQGGRAARLISRVCSRASCEWESSYFGGGGGGLGVPVVS
jgi:hypothetical protein